MTMIAFLVFGPSKLPQIGKSLGGAISGFKKALTDDNPSERIEK